MIDRTVEIKIMKGLVADNLTPIHRAAMKSRRFHGTNHQGRPTQFELCMVWPLRCWVQDFYVYFACMHVKVRDLANPVDGLEVKP